MRTVGIYLFPEVEELDAVGPWQVLASWTGNWPDDGWRVVTFSTSGGEVECAKGLTIRARYRTDEVPALDVLVFPGGRGTRPQLADPTIEVRADERWVDSGEVITASGVSAGIDMALHLVRRLAGAERAVQVRRAIQYDPQPPV